MKGGLSNEELVGLIGDRRQLGGVRQIELQDGAERGLRVLSFSTGGGLDFWVMVDRSLDIGLLHFRGMPVAWHHPEGFATPWLHERFGDSGTSFERALGGFLMTCGLDNVRQPRNGMPLHGSLPMRPARISGYGEEWKDDARVLYAQGEVTSAHLNGSCFRMKRRIQCEIGATEFEIADEVENIGTDDAEMMILYHVNFGFPAISDGTKLFLNDDLVYILERNGREAGKCEPTVACHPVSGKRFQARLIRPANEEYRGFSAVVDGPAASLPFFQRWYDPRPRRNILALEPSNCDRSSDGTSLAGTRLAPGEKWRAALRFAFSETE